MSDHTTERLFDLAGAVCDGDASQADLSELNSIMFADRAACRRYLHYCHVHSALRLELRAQHAAKTAFQQIGIRPAAAGPNGLNAVAVESTVPSVVFGLPATNYPPAASCFFSNWILAYLIATVVVGTGLSIMAIVRVSQPMAIVTNSRPPLEQRRTIDPKREIVGQITGIVNCKWGDPQTTVFNGVHVSLGCRYALNSGLLEITYNTGAKVILLGPVTYEVESANGGFLFLGKLTGKVETRQAKGFAIRTPTAVVTDLGTEFGVEVGKDGNTRSHVFRGSVKVQCLSARGKPEGAERVLRENQSVQIGGQGNERKIIAVVAAKSADFMPALPKQSVIQLDLVDVVAGGDGFFGKRNAGIDPTNGNIEGKLPKPAVGVNDYTIGDYQYHRVKGSPFVDGVFIPDGSRGPVQTDSAGNVFHDCPVTSNQTVELVWACADDVAKDQHFSGLKMLRNGVDHTASGNALLFMASNKGITFDLDAVRRANPKYRLSTFRSLAGNCEPDSARGGNVYADLWILIDGKVQYRRWQINNANGCFEIAIPIGNADRFLTLVSTDGGNGIAWDWIAFSNPRLELVAISKNAPNQTRTSPSRR